MCPKQAKRKGVEMLLIKNGKIFTASDSFLGDILIEGEKIVQIGTNICQDKGTEIIDATGLEIYPGGVDAHTHLDMPFMGTITVDDFESGTIAAACGGTTTIIDFVIPEKGKSLHEAIDIWMKKAYGKSAIDFAFHIALVEFTEDVVKEIPEVIEKGITSFKCFMAYKPALYVDDYQLLEIFRLAKKEGALMSVHAENGDMLVYVTKHLLAEGKTGPEWHDVAHPDVAEAEAAHRAIVLADFVGVPIYFVHTSSRLTLKEIQKARRKGKFVFCETCPQYLVLNNELYRKNGWEAAKWVMSPPLRDKKSNEKLWAGIRDGFVDTVGTDHCSFNFVGQKDLGRDVFTKIPNGIPAIEERVKILYSEGVMKGRISRNRFVEVIATNPAKIFGLYPQKGTIAVGSDADIVIFDPNKKGVISARTHKMKVDYSAFEGIELQGMPVYTISRGKLIVKDYQFLGEKTHGKYIRRKRFDLREWGRA